MVPGHGIHILYALSFLYLLAGQQEEGMDGAGIILGVLLYSHHLL